MQRVKGSKTSFLRKNTQTLAYPAHIFHSMYFFFRLLQEEPRAELLPFFHSGLELLLTVAAIGIGLFLTVQGLIK